MTLPSVRTRAVLGTAVLALVLLLVWWWPDSGDSTGVTVEGSSSTYTVRIRLPHPSPAPGEAEIVVVRRDRAVLDLDQVTVAASMPSMGHTMAALTAQPDGPGRYRADGRLFLMAGSWQLSVRLHSADGTDVVTLPVTVPVA
ncbi:FixH family protein [Streptomyces sp. NBC_00988]|uniref:FixH family protein n=1 Tax=Streptomyces sp. NBC_00988 TaxID=2903704 RepID=UPI003864E035|nr:FixH family protein [Streptomyces sp. NBC_00988]